MRLALHIVMCRPHIAAARRRMSRVRRCVTRHRRGQARRCSSFRCAPECPPLNHLAAMRQIPSCKAAATPAAAAMAPAAAAAMAPAAATPAPPAAATAVATAAAAPPAAAAAIVMTAAPLENLSHRAAREGRSSSPMIAAQASVAVHFVQPCCMVGGARSHTLCPWCVQARLLLLQPPGLRLLLLLPSLRLLLLPGLRLLQPPGLRLLLPPGLQLPPMPCRQQAALLRTTPAAAATAAAATMPPAAAAAAAPAAAAAIVMTAAPLETPSHRTAREGWSSSPMAAAQASVAVHFVQPCRMVGGARSHTLCPWCVQARLLLLLLLQPPGLRLLLPPGQRLPPMPCRQQAALLRTTPAAAATAAAATMTPAAAAAAAPAAAAAAIVMTAAPLETPSHRTAREGRSSSPMVAVQASVAVHFVQLCCMVGGARSHTLCPWCVDRKSVV